MNVEGTGGTSRKSKPIMEEIQPAGRNGVFYETGCYYWKSENSLLLGSEERTELQSMSASSRGIVSSASITILCLPSSSWRQ